MWERLTFKREEADKNTKLRASLAACVTALGVAYSLHLEYLKVFAITIGVMGGLLALVEVKPLKDRVTNIFKIELVALVTYGLAKWFWR